MVLVGLLAPMRIDLLVGVRLVVAFFPHERSGLLVFVLACCCVLP